MKTKLAFLLIVCGLFRPVMAATIQTTNTQSADNPTTVTSAKPRLSSGLDEVVKLSKAGINEGVILVYVQNSSVAYSPTAQDLIQLQEAGVTATVTAALIQRGQEVKQNAIQAAKQAQSSPPATAPAAPQTTTYAAAPTYTAPASSVTVIGYPSSYVYSYPTYYDYGYCYPRSYYYPSYSTCYSYGRFSVGVGFGGFRGGYWSGHHGGFRHCR